MRERALVPAALLFLVALFVGSAAEAGNCKRGKPCGGACIARDKVCRIAAASQVQAVDRPVRESAPPATIACRWSGRVYRVPAGLCTDGGGFVVR